MQSLLSLYKSIKAIADPAYLNTLAGSTGGWLYVILFAIIFAETGLVVTPFLPGDTLVFAIGALAASPTSPISLPLVAILLIVAAVLGDAVNYAIGYRLGPKVFSREDSKLLNKKHLLEAQRFYEKYGSKTIIIARFVPIVRTFAPFVAGVARMTRSRFTLYDVTGGALWIGSVTIAGYLFGNIPWVKENLDKIIWGAIFIPGLLVFIAAWRARSKRAETPA